MTINELKRLIENTIEGFNASQLMPDTPFSQSGLDSLDHATILMAIDEAYGIKIPDEDMDQCFSLNSTIQYLAHRGV